ncbi:MAG: DUF4345 family protein [Myxococcales bacterium]|nr:DUF4345 family protein [Myxococcales bacterium]
MTGRRARVVVGLALVALGAYLALAPLTVARALDRPATTPGQLINLRASWGGTLAGLGAFVAWLPGLGPWRRTLAGLTMWSMAGIGAARLLGFALDGAPDQRQWVWITAEVALVIGGALALRTFARRAAGPAR